MGFCHKCKRAIRLLQKALKRTLCSAPTTLMLQGQELEVDVLPLQCIDKGYGDWLIHPCVRYISEGFAGHKWWMVCTPYPNYNSHYENPVLYHGVGNGPKPPMKWQFVAVVQNSHERGYNADSNLYFDGRKLWITWKEAETPNTETKHGRKAIMGCCYDGICFTRPKILCKNPDDTNMYLASQVLLRVKNELKLMAVFTANSYRPIPNRAKGPRHMAVFATKEGKNGDFMFQFEGVFHQTYPDGFDFWHIDVFEYKGKYYCLATPEDAESVLLGESQDGMHYTFYDKPLLHAEGKERTPYMYKVSGFVVDGVFYLFYPMKKEKNVVRLHVTAMNFEKLLKDMKA